MDALGMWSASADRVTDKHESSAVSGSYGGHTVDFRDLAARGVILLGRTTAFEDGRLRFSDDIAASLASGDETYFSFLRAADDHAMRQNLDLPGEPGAHLLGKISPASPIPSANWTFTAPG